MNKKSTLYQSIAGLYDSWFQVLYNLAFLLFRQMLPLLSWIARKGIKNQKTYFFFNGQKGLIASIEKEWIGKKENTIWIHCSSYGEFGIARPLIKAIKETTSYKIVLTFFSPSGYEAIKDNHPLIDYLYYLPLDTPSNARRFVHALRPQKAIFMVSELWMNYLKVLEKEQTPTYLVSALITPKSAVSKWYGHAYRSQLRSFTRILTLNDSTRQILLQSGYDRAVVTSDPLFDNVHLIAQTPYRNQVIEAFATENPLFIAGSIDCQEDLKLTAALANNHPETKFVVVPHELYPEALQTIRKAFRGKVCFHSECKKTPSEQFKDCQILIIDYMGELSYLYRYGTWAYVGGGFTPYLHNVLEATVYGLPVAFGPCIERKAVAQELISLQIGGQVRTPEELNRWFQLQNTAPEKLEQVKTTALKYMNEHRNITQGILHLLDFQTQKESL